MSNFSFREPLTFIMLHRSILFKQEFRSLHISYHPLSPSMNTSTQTDIYLSLLGKDWPPIMTATTIYYLYCVLHKVNPYRWTMLDTLRMNPDNTKKIGCVVIIIVNMVNKKHETKEYNNYKKITKD